MLSLRHSMVWLKPKNVVSLKIPARNLAPTCGPPRYRMTFAQKILIGGSSILLMAAIPIWGLLSLPTWAIKHQNLGKARKED